LDCQSSSLNAVFGREVRIQMLKMAVLDRQGRVRAAILTLNISHVNAGEKTYFYYQAACDLASSISMTRVCRVCNNSGATSFDLRWFTAALAINFRASLEICTN